MTLVGAGVLVVVASFLLLPSTTFRLPHIRDEAEAPLLDRQWVAAGPACGPCRHRCHLHTMVFNTRQLVVPRTQALVTRHLNVQDVREFRSQHPHVKIITLSYRGKPYYVLLSSG
ncbi:MAG: hypothetical protein WAK71_23390 [Streptosporangiaceae bacterium]